MKQRLLALALSATLTRASAVYGQTPHTGDAQKILELVKELQVQQRQIDDNQGKIDAKIAELAETIRVARIEASRDGGRHKPPPHP